MPTDDLNIELLLDFAQQQDELITGHQKEMSQVLANKEHLRTALASEHNRANKLEEEIKILKAKLITISEENTQLQLEIEQLRNRPTHTNTYIENEYINEQHNYPLHRTSCTTGI